MATLLRLRRAARAAALRRLVETQGRVAAGRQALAAARARAGEAAAALASGPAARAEGELACAVARARASGEVVLARAGELRRDLTAVALAVEVLDRADAAQRSLEAVEVAWRRARWRRLERGLEAEADDRGRPGPGPGPGLRRREGTPWGTSSRSLRPPRP